MKKRNVKLELLEISKGKKIKCADVKYEKTKFNKKIVRVGKSFVLKVGHTEEEYKEFLNSLDFGYNDGYGGQELFGIVWFEDGTWLTRAEYDGSEWWEHHIVPEIPERLK